jgi:hypothetical protein
MVDRLKRPAFAKAPFGGTPAPPMPPAAKKVSTNEMLPGRKALNQIVKGTNGNSLLEAARLDPIGSGALDQDFLNTKKLSF